MPLVPDHRRPTEQRHRSGGRGRSCLEVGLGTGPVIIGDMHEPVRKNGRNPWGDAVTPYVEIGGEDGVRRLAETFYDVIEEDSPILRQMLPASTRNTRRKLFMYLTGWMGGPPLYQEKWGHPRLRMRHMPFPIGDDEAGEWMRCMRLAMERSGVGEPLSGFLESRFRDLALHMRNQS